MADAVPSLKAYGLHGSFYSADSREGENRGREQMLFKTGYVSDRIRRGNKGRCEHISPILVVDVEGGKQAQCLKCLERGPVRVNSEAARKALLVLGARD